MAPAPMRLAVLADIHGNLPALEAVLADGGLRGVDAVMNLGDLASGPLWPLWPRETVERLAPLALPTVRGNHDRAVAGPDAMGPSDAYAFAALDAGQRAWLGPADGPHRCPGRGRVSRAARRRRPLPHGGHRGRSPRPGPAGAGGEAARASTPAPVLLCGHSHQPRVLRLADGRTVVNPGSVGCPAYDAPGTVPHVSEVGSPHARYAVVTIGPGEPRVELIALPYDHEAAAARAEANGRPEWARGLRMGSLGA